MSTRVDSIRWVRIGSENAGDHTEHRFRAENVEHAGCGGDVLMSELHDAMGGVLNRWSRCGTCGEDLGNG